MPILIIFHSYKTKIPNSWDIPVDHFCHFHRKSSVLKNTPLWSTYLYKAPIDDTCLLSAQKFIMFKMSTLQTGRYHSRNIYPNGVRTILLLTNSKYEISPKI